MFLLTRTNPEVAKHKGLTTFLVPLRQPGVEIQPVYTVSGERTNLTFYSDVRVDDSLRIGEVDGGWEVMTVGLTLERSVTREASRFGCCRAMERVGAGLRRRRRAPEVGGSRRPGSPRSSSGRERGQHPAGSPVRLGAELGGAARGRRIDGQAVRLGGADPAVGGLHGPARPGRHPGRRGSHGRPSGIAEYVLPVRAGNHDLRGHKRDPAKHHRPARPRTASTLVKAPPAWIAERSGDR